MVNNNEIKGFAYGGLAVILWGINYIFVKKGVQVANPIILTLVRLSFALPLMLVFRPKHSILVMSIVTTVWNIGCFNLIALALYLNLSSTAASFLQQSNSVFLIILSSLFLKERLNVDKKIFILLSLLGVGIFFIPSISFGELNIGAFLVLLSAILWAFGVVLMKKFRIDGSLGTVVWMAGLASIIQAPIAYFALPFESFNVPKEAVFYALSSFLLSSVVANLLWLRAARFSQSDALSHLILMIPLVVLISDFYIMNTVAGEHELIGGFVIMLAGLLRFIHFYKSPNL